MSNESLPKLRKLYTAEIGLNKIGEREKQTYEDMVAYNQLAEKEPTYERIEIHIADDVKARETAIVNKLKEVQESLEGWTGVANKQIQNIIEELERE